MPAVARIIDANANRAREAIRVLEDAARFGLDDRPLTSGLKRARHALRDALAALPEGWLAANRDLGGDVGRELIGAGEGARENLIEIAAAAGARATEALRAIEEASKTIDAAIGQRIRHVRYDVYALARDLEARLGTGRGRQWSVCLLLTESACRLPWRDVVAESVAAGVECIQVREPALDDRRLRRRCAEVIEQVRPAGTSVIVNDRPDIALVTGADGVHLGQHDLDVADVRRLAGRALLVGVSTHSIGETEAAVAAGADYVGLGAMFATGTKDPPPPVGPAYVRAFVERFEHMPHLAIGGITPANVGRVAEAGARGVAVCAAICGAGSPGDAVAAFRAHLARPHPLTADG